VSSDLFNSSCGLRQGDSLSPLLSVVVMEALSKMFTAIVENASVFSQAFVLGLGALMW
jgi:hypothetical protein